MLGTNAIVSNHRVLLSDTRYHLPRTVSKINLLQQLPLRLRLPFRPQLGAKFPEQ